MTKTQKWILAGVIAVVLLIGIGLGATLVPLASRLMWGYGPGYALGLTNAPVGPGMMMGQRWDGQMPMYGRMMPPGNFGPGMMNRGNFGPGMMGRGGFGPGMMNRGNFGPGMMGRGGFGPGWGGPGESLLSITAEKLGLTTDELVTELKAEKSIADLATDKGVSLDTIVEALVASRSERMAELVKDGGLTQEQADAHLAAMKADITARLSQKWSAGEPGFGPMWR